MESQWQPIETAPKTQGYIDLWVKNQRVADCWWCDKRNGWCLWGPNEWGEYGVNLVMAYCGNPTHWMPIAGPPSTPQE